MIKKIAVVVLLAGAYLGVSYLLQPKLREVLRAPQAQTQNQASETAKTTEGNADPVSYNCEGGKTAFDGLVKETKENVETKDSPFGKMVNAINGIKGGTNNKYWIYFVDGKSATISADNYKCQGTEKVEWKFLEPK